MSSAQVTTIPAEGEALSPKAEGADYEIRDCGYETLCWVWLRGLMRGYPRIALAGTDQRAHRAYYELAYGPIPAGRA